MSGLQNALAKVVTQNDQVANELQGQPASIKFTSNSTAEIERAIKSFGKFEEVSDQGSSEQPVYSNVQHGSAQSNTLPCLLPPPTLPPPPPPVAKRRPNIAVFAGCTLRSYYDVPDTQNEYDQPSKMMTPSLDQTVYIQLPAMHQKRSHETPYDIPTCDLPTDRLDLPCPLPNDICKQQHCLLTLMRATEASPLVRCQVQPVNMATTLPQSSTSTMHRHTHTHNTHTHTQTHTHSQHTHAHTHTHSQHTHTHNTHTLTTHTHSQHTHTHNTHAHTHSQHTHTHTLSMQ